MVIDTDAFSRLYVNRRQGRDVAGWRKSLLGRRVVIAFQSRAELLSGARIAGWGQRRTSELREILDRTPTVPADEDVIEAFVQVTADSRAAGHGLHAKVNTGDRWVAACAIAHGLPLLSADGIFKDTPGLQIFYADGPTRQNDA